MQMNEILLESLLHQEEGPALDFKGYQYQFDKASDDEKGELLKDILAFANTRRELPAYILIGVGEVKGGRSNVVGVKTHLDDARLHQFVNSKTQQAVEFSYTPYSHEEVEIGIIEIPVQDGLIHLKQSYGKLHANVVYIRDGSSTRTSTPAEIIEMTAPKLPELVLSWADLESSSALPSPYAVKSLILYPQLPLDTFEIPAQPPQILYGFDLSSLSYSQPNPEYSQELIVFTFYQAFHMPLGLQLHNESGVAAKRVLFEGTIKKEEGFSAMDKSPSFPRKYVDRIPLPDVQPLSRFHDAQMELQEDNESWKISVEFGDIRPDENITTVDTLWFGSNSSGVARLEGKLLGDNISEPIHCVLEIRFETEYRPMTEEDVINCRRVHFEAMGIDEE